MNTAEAAFAGLTMDEIVARAPRFAGGNLEEVLAEEVDRGNLELVRGGRYRFTPEGWKRIGEPLAALVPERR